MSKFGGIPVESANPQGQGGSQFGGVPTQAASTPPMPQAPQPQQDQFSVGNVVGSALTGFNDLVAGLPGDVMDASGFIARNTVAPAIDYVAGTNYADQIAAAPSVGQAMRDDVAQVIPRTLPESRAARYGQAAGRGVASALVTGAGGMLAQGARGVAGTVGRFLAPQTARELAVITGAGAGSGVGAKAGRAVGQEVGGNTGAALGELVGGIGGGIAAGAGVDRAVGAALRPRPGSAPTLERLRAMKDDAYSRAEQAGVIYTQPALVRIANEAQAFLAKRGYRPAIHPNVALAIKEIENDASLGNHTLKSVDTLRQVVRQAVMGSGVKPAEKAFGSAIIKMIDDMVAAPRAGEVLMGDARMGAAAISQARALNRRLMAAEKVDRMAASAEYRAATTGSGGNVQNATRQEFRKVTDPMYPYRAEGLAPAEVAAMREIARGSNTQNALRAIGAMGPSGNGLGLMLHSGAALGTGGMSVPISIAAATAKHIAESMTKSQVRRLGEMIRSGASTAPRVPVSTPTAIPKAAANSLLSQYGPRIQPAGVRVKTP